MVSTRRGSGRRHVVERTRGLGRDYRYLVAGSTGRILLSGPRIGRAADHDPDRLRGLVADRPQPVRRRGVERDRRARAELVLVEPDAHAERPARDVAVLAPAVRDERVVGARFGADRIDDVEELDVRVAVRGEPLPADTRSEVDD